jgi:hypothetical protein
MMRVVIFGMLGALVAAPFAMAQTGDVSAGLSRCLAMGDAQARLACYDDLARSVAPPLTHVAAPVAPTPPVVAPPPPQATFGQPDQATQTTPEQFGSESLPRQEAPKPEAPKEIDSIAATVTEYAKNPFGKFIVFLDNGQVWRQLQGDSGEARFNRKPSDNKVRIERGLLGSYTLLLNDSAKTFKVERIK